jgi:hypothetical protein
MTDCYYCPLLHKIVTKEMVDIKYKTRLIL